MKPIELLQDGTLVVNTELYPKVKRVLVEHETNGTLYYSDGAERPKGKWKIKSINNCNHYCCSICNEQSFELGNYCLNCGAEMEVEK